MTELVVPDLVLKGVVAVFNSKMAATDQLDQSVSATQNEINRMSGIMTALREEVEDMNQVISNLINDMTLEKCRNRKNEMLKSMSDISPEFRESILEVSMTIQAVIEETCIETVCLEVSRIILDEDEEDEAFCNNSHKLYFFDHQSSAEVVTEILSVEKGDKLFSGVTHVTEDRMKISIHAWAPTEKSLPKITEATGALYAFCQTLCDRIADTRGVFATAIGDGNIAQSRTPLCSNSSIILLNYDWPSPTELGTFGQIVRDASAGDREATDQLFQAFERKGEKQQTKNVYLIGQTGEGKSTLANTFTGTDNFPVSFAGTGTYAISGYLVQPGGALDIGQPLMVWDTPGMNDQDGLDQMFENMMYSHLSREQTVSTIFIVSKDGSRFPGTVKEMIRVYKKAFGESLLNCLAVLVGIRLEEASEAELKAKRTLWVKKVSQEIGHRLPRDQVYFYDARKVVPQKELLRIRKMIDESDIFLTGTGRTIYQGILELRNESNERLKKQKKAMMQVASNEVVEGIHEEVIIHPRIRFIYNEKGNVIEIKLFESRRTALKDFLISSGEKSKRVSGKVGGILMQKLQQGLRNLNIGKVVEWTGGGHQESEDEDGARYKRKKELRFAYAGDEAEKVVKSVGFPLLGVPDKDRFNLLMLRARRHKLIMTKMENETSAVQNERIQVSHYLIVDIEDNLSGEVYSRIEAIIGQLVNDRHVAEPLIQEIGNVKNARISTISSSS